MQKKILIAILLLAIAAVYGCTGNSVHAPNIQGAADGSGNNIGINSGNLAPDFAIDTIDGKTLRLSELTSEKPTVLYFFATWCPNCARDLGAVKGIYPKYADKINFLAIDMDPGESKAQISSYQQQMNLPEVQFAAAKRDVLAKYNVVYTTTKYFIGKDGSILNKGVGGIDAATWEQIFQAMSQ